MFGRIRRLAALVAVTATCAAALVTAAVTAAPPQAHADPAGNGLLIWGVGVFGQLGDGTTIPEPDRLTPGPVPAFPTGVKQVSIGGDHVAVLKTDGTVWTWGDNAFGQLGDGGTESIRSTPAQVPGLAGIVQISLGGAYSLALRGDGTVWAWGQNSDGQLGIGSTTNALVPTEVLTNDVTQIAAGDTHSIAIRTGGRVYGWGEADHGEVTGVPLIKQTSPIPVPGVGPATSIASGFIHSLAVVNGQVIQWGEKAGATSVIQTPTVMSGPAGVTQVAAGYGTSAALTGDGQVWTWGNNNFGQLGNGTETSSTTPAQVTSLSGVVQVAATYDNMVARLGSGTVFGWGETSAARSVTAPPPSATYPPRPPESSGPPPSRPGRATRPRSPCRSTSGCR